MIKIAVCFFGITRSLKHTFPSIRDNILDACESCGETRIYSHFYNQTTISEARTGEFGTLDPSEHTLIPSDWVSLEEPDTKTLQKRGEELAGYGDAFNDDFRTLRNLIHQLHSMEQASLAALSWQPDIAVFVRPDLRYINSFHKTLSHIVSSTNNGIWLPNWQHWSGGYNDRFAICRGEGDIRAIGLRGRLALEFCKETCQPLDPEKLIRFAIERYGAQPNFVPLRAVRVRFGGVERKEIFVDYRIHNIRQKLSKLAGSAIGFGRGRKDRNSQCKKFGKSD